MIIYIDPTISLEALFQEMRDSCKFAADQRTLEALVAQRMQ